MPAPRSTLLCAPRCVPRHLEVPACPSAPAIHLRAPRTPKRTPTHSRASPTPPCAPPGAPRPPWWLPYTSRHALHTSCVCPALWYVPAHPFDRPHTPFQLHVLTPLDLTASPRASPVNPALRSYLSSCPGTSS